MGVKKSHTLSIGIVGLPNSGKSSLFNSITKNSVPAENFPFCTIDKNVGVVHVPDKRLKMLENHFNAKKVVPSAITFVDIAGLVKGASKGEGLGNQFLAHIREVDVIMYVLRSFKSDTITHVYDRINPAADLEIVQSELILKDLDTISKKIGELDAKNRFDDDYAFRKSTYTKVLDWLNSGKPAVELDLNQDEQEFVEQLWLLTMKKRIYLLNVRAGMDLEERKTWKEILLQALPDSDKEYVLETDVKLVGDLLNLESDEERESFISMIDERPALFEDIVRKAFDRLDLLTFYTGSEKEVNAWSIERGATAKEAAGVIHTDLMNSFVTADVVDVEKMIEVGGVVQAREKGLVKNQGKDYIVEDGQYILIHATA